MSKCSSILLCCLCALSTYSQLCFSSPQSADSLYSVSFSLDDLFKLADEQNTIIRINQQALSAAHEAVMQARNTMLPHLAVSVSGSYIGDATLMSRSFSTSGTTDVVYAGLGVKQVNNGQQPTPHWSNIFSFEASQVIYAGGALAAGYKMAKIGERMAELSVEQARQDVRFMLTGYYLDLVRLNNQVAVMEQHIALTERVLAQMQAKQSAGVVLRNDLMRYELQLKQLQLSLLKLHDAQAIINHQITIALHLPNNFNILTDISIGAEQLGLTHVSDNNQNASNTPTSLSSWQSTATQSNLTLQQTQAAAALTEQQFRLTRSASIPTITIFAKDELFGPYTQDLIPVDANVNAWFVGIGLQYDLSSIWTNHRAIKRAKVEHRTAQTQLELAQEELSNKVFAAYTNYLTALTEVDTQIKQVELADENYNLVEKRYNNELALLTDLLDASNIKLQADMALVKAKVVLLYSYFQLKYITNTL